MVIEYTWTDNSVSWTLVSSGQLKAQDAGYTLTPDGDKTKVRFDMKIDLSIPMPGFILKRTLKGGMETATDGLRKQVLKVKKVDDGPLPGRGDRTRWHRARGKRTDSASRTAAPAAGSRPGLKASAGHSCSTVGRRSTSAST